MTKVSKNNSSLITDVQDIHKTFLVGEQEIEVLKGISFKVYKGDFLILFGPSGCGKSTVLNTILGLEPPTKGTVTFLGKDLYKYNEDERAEIRKKDIGMVYQQSNWIKALNVVENVCFPLTLSGTLPSESEKKAIELLKMVQMEQAAIQIPTELSSGQQQRISLTRALITNPAVIIADEPTGNLDSKAGTDIMNLFKEFNDKGTTVIMVTHDLEYLPYATRSVSMLDGQVEGVYEAGDPALKKMGVSKKIHRGEKPVGSDDNTNKNNQAKAATEKAATKEEPTSASSKDSEKNQQSDVQKQSADQVKAAVEDNQPELDSKEEPVQVKSKQSGFKLKRLKKRNNKDEN